MLTASLNTYCEPRFVSLNCATLDRMATEDMAWNRAPLYLRKPGYFQGKDALLVRRKGSLEPVALSDLTGPELDRLLTVPAFVAGAM